MSAGLYQDADFVKLHHDNLIDKRVSLFELEMRRRIWSTIAELELLPLIGVCWRDMIIDRGPPSRLIIEAVVRVQKVILSAPILLRLRSKTVRMETASC